MAIIDHALPTNGPPPPWDRVLRISLFITADWRRRSGLVSGLQFHAIGFSRDDRDPGKLGRIGGNRDDLLATLLGAEALYVAGNRALYATPEAQPLDFQVGPRTLVALRLHGDHWEFQSAAGGIRTAEKQGGTPWLSHPMGLALDGGRVVEVAPDARCRCLCFITGEDGPPLTKTNLHINFLDTQGGKLRRLPVIIDPGVENQGGNKPPQNP
jgi:hypothetical protein